MAVETSFSLEELDYLRGLPEFTEPMDHVENRHLGWSMGPRNQWHSWAGTCARLGCDVWIHFHGEWSYLRHGDVIAKVPRGKQPSKNFKPWLDAIHAHEAAVR